ncbi:MAG: OmpA family protein [Planctomycetaceae bacterium]|jgi:chemotaxis protein MotB|nr:OmpA family protein [Planctomycetaceae bacterium]
MKKDLFSADGIFPPEEETAPFWMISFSDMATILLTFFVMLYSYSTMNTSHAEAVAVSLKQQFGTKPGARLVLLPEGRKPSVPEILPSKPLPVKTPAQTENSGVILFEENSHELTGAAKTALRELLPLLKESGRTVELCGRAAQEERGVFRDAVDLAYARAYEVRRFFTEQGFEARKMRICTLGGFPPVRDPATGKDLPHCVEIAVLIEDE